MDSHSISVLDSSASSSYDFAWDSALGAGSFAVDSTLAAQGPVTSSILQVGNDGGIWFHTDTGLLFDGAVQMNYALASGDREAEIRLIIIRLDTLQTVFFVGDIAAPVFGDPSSGLLLMAGEVALPPGDYRLSYVARLLSYTGPASAISTATSSIQFNFNPIPESATVVPLATVCILAWRRRLPPRRGQRGSAGRPWV